MLDFEGYVKTETVLQNARKYSRMIKNTNDKLPKIVQQPDMLTTQSTINVINGIYLQS